MLRLPRLLNQFLIGMVWLGFLAFVAAQLTRVPFPLMFASILALSLGGAALVAFLMAKRAERRTPGLQYGIAFLLGLTLYLAALLGAIRWLLLTVGEVNANRWRGDFIPMAGWAICASIVVFSIPMVLGLLDSLLWSANWLMRQSWLRSTVVRVGRWRPRR